MASIIFEEVSWKNFLSTGNVRNTINLVHSKKTLIVGKNGNGKSTATDAITFALFGKPFRQINKAQIVNSVNGKHCEVSIKFKARGASYVVTRGIKPNFLKIECNGVLMNPPADTRDFQAILEQQILKLNYRTFVQIVILGSASFTPFMQLGAWSRREMIEDILDIRVFTSMNTLLKTRMAETKDELTAVDTSIALSKERMGAQKKLIARLESSNDDAKKTLTLEYNTKVAEYEKLKADIASIAEYLTSKDAEAAKQAYVESNLRIMNLNHKILANEQKIAESSMEIGSVCSTCGQEITKEHLKSVEAERKAIKQTIKDLKSALELEQVVNKAVKIDALNVDKQELKKSEYETALVYAKRACKEKRDQLDALKVKKQENVAEEKIELKRIAEEGMVFVERRNALRQTQKIQTITQSLLKDSGIKTSIIKEYLPIINKLINKYLDALDFFVSFELDENFNEKIKSRHRDDFTYASFSEGEKRRIDVALMFAWRQLANMKNSSNCNILFMDETADASMDAEGIESLVSLFDEMPTTNVFVISHRGDSLLDKFDRVLTVEKEGNFSLVSST